MVAFPDALNFDPCPVPTHSPKVGIVNGRTKRAVQHDSQFGSVFQNGHNRVMERPDVCVRFVCETLASIFVQAARHPLSHTNKPFCKFTRINNRANGTCSHAHELTGIFWTPKPNEKPSRLSSLSCVAVRTKVSKSLNRAIYLSGRTSARERTLQAPLKFVSQQQNRPAKREVARGKRVRPILIVVASVVT